MKSICKSFGINSCDTLSTILGTFGGTCKTFLMQIKAFLERSYFGIIASDHLGYDTVQVEINSGVFQLGRLLTNRME